MYKVLCGFSFLLIISSAIYYFPSYPIHFSINWFGVWRFMLSAWFSTSPAGIYRLYIMVITESQPAVIRLSAIQTNVQQRFSYR